MATDLLRDPSTDGFPADYLIARVNGRRSALVSDWQVFLVQRPPMETNEEEVWRSLLEELDWLYRQMNPKLRKTFVVVFLLFELKTVVLCLRCKLLPDSLAIERILAHSLLAEDLQRVLRHSADTRSAIAAITERFSAYAATFSGLESAYADKGMQGLEHGLLRGYLEAAPKRTRHPVIKQFLGLFIDLRNLMNLYKQLRWDIADGPQFISGGCISSSQFLQVLADKDLAGLDTLVRRVTDIQSLDAASSEGAVETVLLKYMTRMLHKRGREAEVVGPILDYVWRSYIQARNLALLHHRKDIDVEVLSRELIA